MPNRSPVSIYASMLVPNRDGVQNSTCISKGVRQNRSAFSLGVINFVLVQENGQSSSVFIWEVERVLSGLQREEIALGLMGMSLPILAIVRPLGCMN